MQIKTLSNAHISAVIRLYNQSVSTDRYSGLLDELLWTTIIAAKPYYSPDDVLVAYDEDQALGYIHLCNAPNAERTTLDLAKGSIEMLCFDADRPDVGKALITEAVQRHRARGAQTILGCSTFADYPLYRGIFVGLEPMMREHNAHVVEAFLAAGFRYSQHSVEMGIDFERPVAEPNLSVAVDFSVQPWLPDTDWSRATWIGLEPFRSQLTSNDEVAGTCIYALMPVVSAKYGKPVGCIAQLVTHPEWRRKGIGSLLVAKALNHMHEQGARRVTLGTQHDNWAAHATYQRNGMQIEEHVRAFVLDLST